MVRKVLYVLAILTEMHCGAKKTDPIIDAMKTIHQRPVITQVVGIASIEPINRIVQLTSETNGIVRGISANMNDQVKKGQILFKLEDVVERAQVEQARSKLETQRAVIQSQLASLEAAKVQAANAKTNLDRNQRLVSGAATTQQALDDSKFASENAAFLVKASESNLAQQQAKLKELLADLHYEEALLDRKTIKAPSGGIVLAVDVKIGSFVTNNTSMGDFAASGPLIAITEIDELFADRVKVGDQAFIRAQGDTLMLSTGEVIQASPYLKKKSLFSDNANNLEDRRVREVRVQLNNPAKVLIGSRVDCIIKVK